MAWKDMFRKSSGGTATQQLAQRSGLPAHMRTPYSDTNGPEALVYADVFGDAADKFGGAVTRAQAMRVPAVAAARNRVIEKLAGRPLVDYDKTGRTEKQPNWMTRTDNRLALSPHQRLVETLDDLIFSGLSLWAVSRSADGSIEEALHVPFHLWHLDQATGVIYFDGEEVPEGQTVLIPGPHRGILNEAPDLIRSGLDLERAWRNRARTPIPTIILKEREDNGMTVEEAKPYVEAVAAARRNPDGAVMFLPYKIDAEIPAATATDHLESARNAIRLDVAGYFNLNAQGVEAAKAQSTLTYETAEQAEAQTTDRVSFWTEPIEARLSLDDVVPRQHRVRFDFTDQDNPKTGTLTED